MVGLSLFTISLQRTPKVPFSEPLSRLMERPPNVVTSRHEALPNPQTHRIKGLTRISLKVESLLPRIFAVKKHPSPPRTDGDPMFV